MPNYNFVIDSSFHPFSMEEIMTPLIAYKQVYDQTEAAYEDLVDKSDKFKYLSETLPDDSKAKQIYEGYASSLAQQANDLAAHGLNMANRRALTDLKRRYRGEIGRLEDAQTALDEEKVRRRNNKDTSMLYANDNLNIDDFLDNKTPNLYGISGNDLYTKAMAAGKAASSRIYSAGDAGRTLGDYYRDFVQTQGYNPDALNSFQREMLAGEFAKRVSALPELQDAANSILVANGVISPDGQTSNLTGNSLVQAQQQVLRGLVDGAVYNEDHKPMRDEEKMSVAQQSSLAQTYRLHGFEYKNGNWEYNPDRDPVLQRAKAPASGESGKNGTPRVPKYSKPQFVPMGGSGIEYNTNNSEIIKTKGKAPRVSISKDSDGSYVLKAIKGNTSFNLGKLKPNYTTGGYDILIGTVDAAGNSSGINADKFKEFFECRYTEDDLQTIYELLNDVSDIRIDGGRPEDYEFSFSPKKKNDNPGFFRVPKSAAMPTGNAGTTEPKVEDDTWDN